MATEKKKMTANADGTTQIETVPDAPTPPSKSEHISFFDDDEGTGLYSGTILLDGMAVRVRELSTTEVDRYKADSRAINELSQKSMAKDANFSALLREALPLLDHSEFCSEAVSGIHERFNLLSETADADAHAELLGDLVSTLRRIACVRVILPAVTSWDLKRPDDSPVPFTRDTAEKLRISKQIELSEKIVQRSVFGTDFSGFLAPS